MSEVNVNIVLGRDDGPLEATWRATVTSVELGVDEVRTGESPGEVLDEVALILDGIEADLVVQARRLADRVEKENASEWRT